MLIHIPMELQHSHLIKVGANILIGHFKLLLSVFFFFFIWCYLFFFDIEKNKKKSNTTILLFWCRFPAYSQKYLNVSIIKTNVIVYQRLLI